MVESTYSRHENQRDVTGLHSLVMNLSIFFLEVSDDFLVELLIFLFDVFLFSDFFVVSERWSPENIFTSSVASTSNQAINISKSFGLFSAEVD